MSRIFPPRDPLSNAASAAQAGFAEKAHLTRTFKSMFGVLPATLHANARVLSVFTYVLATFPEEGPMEACRHLDHIRHTTPSAAGCEECLATGDTWVHLRECLECGHVGCCDSSKNRHATKHFHGSRHPIVRSIEPGEHWRWCYVDEMMV